MADPLRGVDIHFGGQTRTLKFTMMAFRIAQKALGGIAIKEAIKQLDVATVIDLAAAGFTWQDSRVTPDRVTAWMENEPEKFPELANAVGTALSEAYMRMIPKDIKEQLERDRLMGEEQGSPTPTPTPTKQEGAASATTAGQTSDASTG